MNDILLNVFFAYSRKDTILRERLDVHLSALKRKDFIDTWYDGQIDAGKEWEMEINNNLSKADIILLLISADFIASDYCFKVEMKKAITRHERGDAVVIPILLKPCDWKDLPFSKIQALPQNGKHITSKHWKDDDHALTEIAQSVRGIVEKLRKNKQQQFHSVTELLKEKESLLLKTMTLLEEKEFEIEIKDEDISLKRKELNHITEEYTKKEAEYREKYIQLEDSLKEREFFINAKNDEWSQVINSKQLEINRLKNTETKLQSKIEELNIVIAQFEKKEESLNREFMKTATRLQSKIEEFEAVIAILEKRRKTLSKNL